MADQRNESKEIEGVIVRIFGGEYRIGGEPDEVQQVAEYVDKKMNEISDTHRGRLPKAQVAILAAMEVSAELFGTMRDRKEFADKAHASVDRLTKLVEDRANMSSAEDEEVSSRLEQRLRDRSIRLESSSRVSDRPRMEELADDEVPRLRDPSVVS